MHEVQVYRVSAFTREASGGNEAGVVLLSDWPSDEAMQQVATTVGYSETAFLVKKGPTLHVRYFTPLKEVALCGHASLALLSAAQKEGVIENGRHTLHAKEALLEADVSSKITSLHFKTPDTVKKLENTGFLKTIGLKESMLEPIPIAIMNAGVRELFIGLRSLETLKNYNADSIAIKSVCENHDIEGIYLYVADMKIRTLHVRNFLPALGIQEESATGTAAASVAAHLFNTLTHPPKQMTINQGEWMGKPSRLFVTLNTHKDSIEGIYVSGIATIMDTISVSLNHS